MKQQPNNVNLTVGELKPFIPRFSILFGGSFLLWILAYQLCLRVLTIDEGPAGLIALGGALAAATAGAALYLSQSTFLSEWRSKDKRAGSRLILAAILSWSGAFLAFYFLAMSQGIDTFLAVLLIYLALLAGNILLVILDWELTIYLFFGVLTTLVSYGTFALADRIMNGPNLGVPAGGLSWFIPQAISFSAAMLFAYPMNRIYVFESKGPVLREFAGFVTSRLLLTLIFEFGVFWVIHNLLGINRDLTKILTSILVTVANYLVSKLLIFTEKKDDKTKLDEDLPL